jgi:chaperone required for assembly of F1-ATPase
VIVQQPLVRFFSTYRILMNTHVASIEDGEFVVGVDGDVVKNPLQDALLAPP